MTMDIPPFGGITLDVFTGMSIQLGTLLGRMLIVRNIFLLCDTPNAFCNDWLPLPSPFITNTIPVKNALLGRRQFVVEVGILNPL